MAVVVAASVGMAVSTFVGATTAAVAPWLLVPIVGVWGYFTGLGVALGPRFGAAVLQWSIALLIAVGLPFGPAGAALRAGLVLAGGLLQAALVAVSWALRPGAQEQTELALHALALSPDRPMNQASAPGRIDATLDAFSAALGTVISRLASALRSLHQPEPIPALRPTYAAWAGEPALRGTALVAITDRLVDATNTVDAILCQRLPARQ